MGTTVVFSLAPRELEELRRKATVRNLPRGRAGWWWSLEGDRRTDTLYIILVRQGEGVPRRGGAPAGHAARRLGAGGDPTPRRDGAGRRAALGVGHDPRACSQPRDGVAREASRASLQGAHPESHPAPHQEADPLHARADSQQREKPWRSARRLRAPSRACCSELAVEMRTGKRVIFSGEAHPARDSRAAGRGASREMIGLILRDLTDEGGYHQRRGPRRSPCSREYVLPPRQGRGSGCSRRCARSEPRPRRSRPRR